MLTREIIDRVQSLYSKGIKSDDSRLRNRHIFSKLNSVAVMLISQKAKKKQFLSLNNYQTLSCVKLIKASVHQCPCAPAKGCNFYISELPIPNIISNLNGLLINYVSNLTGKIIFNYKEWENFKYLKGEKYTQYDPYYTFVNNHLLVYYKDSPEIVAIQAVFENMFVSTLFNTCEKQPTCLSPLDFDFPIESDLVEPLIEITVLELVDKFNQSIEDKTNNASDTIKEQSK
jgi:hypothetical protein